MSIELTRGISFPFRFGPKGGVVLSKTDEIDATHINESIKQIVLITLRERVMEPEFGSNTIAMVFQENEPSLDSAVKAFIARSIKRWEPRVKVNSNDIEIIRVYGKINLKIRYLLIPMQQIVTTLLELGDVYGEG